MLHDVVILGVSDEDWTLFSPEPFPCFLYNSVALCNVSMSQSSEARVLSSLSLSSIRRLWIKELLKPTDSKCSRKIPLGSNPFSLSTYFRFKFLKWVSFFFFFAIFYLTHSTTPRDTGTTPQGTYTRRSFGFDSLTRSSSELQQTLVSFSGT
jgi:hypothetical protein